MVRNTVGGKKGKSMASKSIPANRQHLRLSEDPLEMYACVTKINGSGMFNVTTNSGENYLAHVRGKMKGPSKRSNFVTMYSIVLVGLRDWESTKKNCDIICIYTPQEINSLAQMPQLNIGKLITMYNNNGMCSNTVADDNLFSETAGEEDNDMDVVNKKNVIAVVNTEGETEEFNFDDI
jgi:initiation factor 1A